MSKNKIKNKLIICQKIIGFIVMPHTQSLGFLLGCTEFVLYVIFAFLVGDV